jgi:hypothetical protein
VLYHIKDGVKDISLTRERIVALQVHYFTEHVNQVGLTKDAVFMFWWTKYKEFVPLPGDPNREDEHIHIEKSIVSVMKAFLAVHDPFQFLKYTIKYDMRENDIFLLYQEMLGMFDDPEELWALVAAHTLLAADIKAEYLEFFDACKAQQFHVWINFEFKTALRPARNNDD